MLSEADWVRLYRETITPLYGFVSRRTGGVRELAEDITQETWLRALVDWQRHGLPDRPLAWLETVARRLLLNYYRRSTPASLGPGELDLEERATGIETPRAAALVQWGLARLRRGQARLLEAFHLDGKDVRTLATELGLSERAVEGRLRRAREALRQKLMRYIE
ncbi:MAG: sigma-70 family RNA polymerase sigma factor [Planctomycetota bacterium]